jgi:Transposase domain (DUF772)
MMTVSLLSGYCGGIYSSRRIAKAWSERVDFMSIVRLDSPDFRTTCEFRKRHSEALSALFVQVLKLCEKAGLVKLGTWRSAARRSWPMPPSTRRCPSSGWRLARRSWKERSPSDWLPPRRPTAWKTSSMVRTSRNGWPTRKSGPKRFALPRRSWRRKPRPATEAKAKAEADAEEKCKAEGRKKPGKPAAPAPKAQKFHRS